MVCVVCQASIATGSEQYANAWERVRRRFPCCSEACARAFDPDRHWIPPNLPAPASATEQAELHQLAKKRLGGLDHARPVVRELLQAGMAPTNLRALVQRARDQTAAAQADARRTTVMSMLSMVLLRRGKLVEAVDQRTMQSYDDAFADLDAWNAAVARSTSD